MTLSVAMIADDLTGALDASAPFASAGLRTVVACRPGALDSALAEGADVICVNTGTRESDALAAGSIVAAAAERLAAEAPRFVFKKIDSRLKGHPAVEIEAVRRAFLRDKTIIAPAVPELGRVVEGGRLTGHGVAAPLDIAQVCAGVGGTLAVPETSDSGDLSALVGRLATEARPPLLAGARGLAGALAALLARADGLAGGAELPRPLLIGVGSRDPITRRQVEHLVERTDARLVIAPGGEVPDLGGLADITVVATDLADSADAARLNERFAGGLARIAIRSGPAAMVLAGGETAAAVLAALGVALVEMEGDLAPGCPYCRLSVSGRTLVLVTKSGGFGAVDTLSNLAVSRADNAIIAHHH